MKRLLHFTVFILSVSLSYSSFSQTYKVDEKRIYVWDNNLMPADWKHETTEQYTYANGGNKETKIVATSASTSDNLYQHIKTYNSNNDIILDVMQVWNGSQWIDQSRDTYTYYTGTSNVKDITTYNFLLGYDTYKVSYEYSGSDLAKITFEDGSSGSLVNEEKYEYTYNMGLPYQEFGYVWNGTDWDLDERSTASYITGERTVVVQEYNGSTYDDPYERYITKYTISLEKEDEHLQETWNGSAYDPSDRQLNSYDVNENQTIIELQSWVSSAWEPYYKEEKDFSMASLSTESFENENFKVFPNPVKDVLNISSKVKIDKIELYDIVGKKVMQSSNLKEIKVGSLRAGIYIIKVFSKDEFAEKKIVVK